MQAKRIWTAILNGLKPQEIPKMILRTHNILGKFCSFLFWEGANKGEENPWIR